MTKCPDLIPSIAFKIYARSIKKHQGEVSKQVPPPLKYSFLYYVLYTSRGKRCCTLLIFFRQFLTQPCHRPVQMVKVYPLHPSNLEIFLPLFPCPIRTRYDTPVT